MYLIRDGRRDEFHALARDETIPMARRYGHIVVGFGPSLHDEDSYYLIRAFGDEEERRHSLASLYESEAWLRDYDQRVMGLIESYQTAVFTAPSDAVDALVAAARSS